MSEQSAIVTSKGVFIAGGEGDPKQGLAVCLTCGGTKIVKYQRATKLWIYDDGSTHTGHQLELPARETVQVPSTSHIPGLSPLLSLVCKQYEGLGVVREERNVLQGWLTSETRIAPADYRRSVLFSGEPGAGKTKLARTILKPFWEYTENYSRITGAGLDRKEGSLDGKILFIEQFEGNEPGQLKLLMSEGSLTILTADRDSSGRIVSHVHRVKGVPVVFSTAVGAVIDPQLMSRLSNLEIDESTEQTERIIHYKLERWTNIRKGQEDSFERTLRLIDEKCLELGQRLKEINIPFGAQLEQGLPKVLAMRRRLDQIVSLVTATAFVKAALGLRPLIKELEPGPNGKDLHVIALPEDLTDALYCLGDAFSDSMTYFFKRQKQIDEELCKNPYSSAKDIAQALRMSQNRAREYLNSLVDQGCATKTKDKGIYRYDPKPHDTATIKLQATYTEEQLLQWFKQQYPDNNAELTIPEGAKPGFKSPQLVQVPLGTELTLVTVQQNGQETGTNVQFVPDSASEAHTNMPVPDLTSLKQDTAEKGGEGA